MALFKILKGRHNKLDTQSKTDGWAWFTPDNGSFYIDALNTDETTVDRIQINPKSIVIETEIYGSGSSLWDLDNKIFPIINEQIAKNYNGYITINSQDFNLTRQAALANFHIINYENGSLFIQAKGTLPIDTIPVVITLVPASTLFYYTCTINGDGHLDEVEDKIKEGSSYTANIVLDGDYAKYEITVMMGEAVISTGYFQGETYVFEISNVTDNIYVNVRGNNDYVSQ